MVQDGDRLQVGRRTGVEIFLFAVPSGEASIQSVSNILYPEVKRPELKADIHVWHGYFLRVNRGLAGTRDGLWTYLLISV